MKGRKIGKEGKEMERNRKKKREGRRKLLFWKAVGIGNKEFWKYITGCDFVRGMLYRFGTGVRLSWRNDSRR